MGLIKKLFGKKQAKDPEAVVLEPVLRKLNPFASGHDVKAQALIQHYRHWVFVCVSKISQAMAAVPLRLYVTTNQGQKYNYIEQGKDTKSLLQREIDWLASQKDLYLRIRKAVLVEEIVEHPYLNLWREVNPVMDGFEMLELIGSYLLLTGDAYVWKQRDATGKPISLWVLQSQYTEIVPGKGSEGFIKGYLYGRDKHNQIALDADEVIHFRLPNPHDPFYGFSPLQAEYAAVKRKEDYDSYEDSLLKNNARPDFVVKAKGRLTTEQIDELRDRFKQLYGKRKSGSPAFVDQDADITTLGFSPREMSNLKGRKETMIEILAAFGVPISKVTTTDVNLANAEIGELQFQRDTVRPLLMRVQEKLNQDLTPDFDERLFVAFDNNIPENEQFKLEKQSAHLERGVVTINEVRETEGLEPVEWGTVAWLNSQLLPVASPEPPAAAANGDETRGYKTLYPWTNNQARELVGKMTSIMQAYYRDILKAVMKNLDKVESPEQLSLEPVSGINGNARFAAYIKGAGNADEIAFDTEFWSNEVGKRMGDPIRSTLVAGAVESSTALGIQFQALNPEVVAWLDSYVFKFANKTTAQLSDEFARLLNESLEAQESIPKLRKRVEGFFENKGRVYANLVARTEHQRAMARGIYQGWVNSGVVTYTVWDAQRDSCPFCAELNGNVVALGEPFRELGGRVDAVTGIDEFGEPKIGTLKMNYETLLTPPLHPNCVCRLRAVTRNMRVEDVVARVTAQHPGRLGG